MISREFVDSYVGYFRPIFLSMMRTEWRLHGVHRRIAEFRTQIVPFRARYYGFFFLFWYVYVGVLQPYTLGVAKQRGKEKWRKRTRWRWKFKPRFSKTRIRHRSGPLVCRIVDSREPRTWWPTFSSRYCRRCFAWIVSGYLLSRLVVRLTLTRRCG